MHRSAMKNGKLFFDTYLRKDQAHVVEIGAQDVNGSLKSVCPVHYRYTGVDFVAGRGVDVILKDPYQLPFEDNSVDMVVSSSVFEHSEMFWLSFLEILRVLRPNGLVYMNVPSNGGFHRFPVDCWRFYPDSGQALVRWAQRNGYDPVLLESFISQKDEDQWNDFVAVFLKDASLASQYPRRILDTKRDFYNGTQAGKDGFINFQEATEDQQKEKLSQKVQRTFSNLLGLKNQDSKL